MDNLFEKDGFNTVISRLNQIELETKPQWGSMNSAQMLAHLNVMFEKTYESGFNKPKGLMKLVMKLLIKPGVVGKKAYKRNSRTAPEFLIADSREFEIEKNRLIAFLEQTNQLGTSHFEGREYVSFGPLSQEEWNTMFVKHIDHHFKQFGV